MWEPICSPAEQVLRPAFNSVPGHLLLLMIQSSKPHCFPVQLCLSISLCILGCPSPRHMSTHCGVDICPQHLSPPVTVMSSTQTGLMPSPLCTNTESEPEPQTRQEYDNNTKWLDDDTKRFSFKGQRCTLKTRQEKYMWISCVCVWLRVTLRVHTSCCHSLEGDTHLYSCY